MAEPTLKAFHTTAWGQEFATANDATPGIHRTRNPNAESVPQRPLVQRLQRKQRAAAQPGVAFIGCADSLTPGYVVERFQRKQARRH